MELKKNTLVSYNLRSLKLTDVSKLRVVLYSFKPIGPEFQKIFLFQK